MFTGSRQVVDVDFSGVVYTVEVEARDWGGVREDWPRSHRDRSATDYRSQERRANCRLSTCPLRGECVALLKNNFDSAVVRLLSFTSLDSS